MCAIESFINPNDVHCARTRLICVDNTWHGHPLTPAYLHEVRAIADKYGLSVHIDGARLFNAAVALNLQVRDLVADADSVQICFSKGLACPAGSIICGTEKFIAEARRVRQALGGTMRQTGMLAAACLVALKQMVDRLAEDHTNARLLSDGLAKFPEIDIAPGDTNTNIMFFHTSPAIKPDKLLAQLRSAGVLVGWSNARMGFRAVTHYGISHEDIVENAAAREGRPVRH